MAQDSFPKGAAAEKPMSDQEWKLLMMAIPDGMIDRGGYPYLLTNKDNATNKITIQVDQITGFNQAVLHGFLHVMNEPEQLTIPAVTSGTKTFCVGLVYDPAKHSAPNGPVTLTVWEAPGDFTQGKARLVLYRVTRSANQLLTNATFTQEKPRVAPGISVSNREDLPRSEMTRVDTLALIRNENKLVRLDRPTAGPGVWVDIAVKDAEVENATPRPLPNTIMKRGTTGAVEVETRGSSFGSDAANVDFVKGYVASNTPQITSNTGAVPGLMARNDNGQTSVGAATAGPHAVNKSQLDSAIATRAPSGHTHDGSDIRKTGGDVPWEVITGSTSAYNTTSGGSTWATVAVASNGRFFRYPSALKYKKNIRAYNPSVEDALAIRPVMYDSKDTGVKDYIGVVADAHVETFPNLVQFGEDGEVEGWHYQLWPVVQQVVLRDLDARDKAKTARIDELEAKLEALTERLDAIEKGAGA